MIAFGPVPSRRLGRSLGINNIPPKVCTYSCAYCQVGRTIHMEVDRRPFYTLNQIVNGVQEKVESARQQGEPIDYLTFVPDGEPTLDVNLGSEVELLKALGIKVAVITNASLLWREDARDALMSADWVSVKLDSVWQDTWQKVNRPVRTLDMPKVLGGVRQFADAFEGELVTETMLLKGMNDGESHAEALAYMLAKLRPATSYLSIPIRPPAEEWAQAPSEETINRFYQILSGSTGRVEYLIGYEGNAFASTGDLEEDMLSITAVHPMREEAVNELLTRAGQDWPTVHRLIAEGQLVETEHEGRKFYMRRLPGRRAG